MANDNQGGRAFLAIVLGGIVLALVIAAYFMYGHKGDTNVKVEHPSAPAQPPETAPPAAQTRLRQRRLPPKLPSESTEEPSEPPAEESSPGEVPPTPPVKIPHNRTNSASRSGRPWLWVPPLFASRLSANALAVHLRFRLNPAW